MRCPIHRSFMTQHPWTSSGTPQERCYLALVRADRDQGTQRPAVCSERGLSIHLSALHVCGARHMDPRDGQVDDKYSTTAPFGQPSKTGRTTCVWGCIAIL